MNFAEGRGPKQTKKTWPLGQFVTIYGNGSSSNVNPASVPYPNVASGGWNGGVVGSIVPGLCINSSSLTDVGFVCSPGSNESVQDLQNVGVTLFPNTGFTGSGIVTLQGASNRYLNNTVFSGNNWINLGSVTVSGGNGTFTISASGTFPLYNAYRLVISGYSTASGIVDWAIAGLFTDLSAMGIGQESTWANGSLGQLPQNGDNDIISISGGQLTGYSEGGFAYENTKANHTWIG